MKINIKRLSDRAFIPFKSNKDDAGFDMVATSRIFVEEEGYGYVEYGTGIAMSIPPKNVGLLFPRSSISNTGLLLANSVGVIDSGYLDEIKFRFKYVKDSKLYDVGDRIGQLMIMPLPVITFNEVKDLEGNDRGGGFGSTNK